MNGYFGKNNLAGIGPIWIAKTSKGICRLSFGGSKSSFLKALPQSINWIESDTHLKNDTKLISSLIDGEKEKIAIELIEGTTFQRSIWQKIKSIPFGKTKSYTWLAAAVGSPKAYRAAANACGANPIPLIIPCHRIIASDGSIGGFSSGITLKRRLLKNEEIYL
ncbi:MAG: methylated-DNA--[protein]-cysteine S-methyltransferase [Deltaproteobacteria bacterium]|nr:methylated-DNA--[protein]-cysteine S-methyltransferase [Deltaproteobacteria bacterium]